jgi:hypothetical protein
MQLVEVAKVRSYFIVNLDYLRYRQMINTDTVALSSKLIIVMAANHIRAFESAPSSKHLAHGTHILVPFFSRFK